MSFADSSGVRPASKQPTTDRYTKDKRALIAWIGAALGMVGIGMGSYAFGKLNTHDSSIAVLESETRTIKETQKEHSVLLREILTKMPRQP